MILDADGDVFVCVRAEETASRRRETYFARMT